MKMSLLSAIAIMLSFALFSIPAHTNELSKDLYVSIGAGQSKLGFNNHFFEYFPETTESSKFNYQIGLGHRFGNFAASEFEYFNLGEYQAVSSVNGSEYAQKVDISIKKFSLIGIVKFPRQIFLNFYLGLGWTNENYSAVGKSGPVSVSPGVSYNIRVTDVDNSRFVPFYGYGIGAQITPEINLLLVMQNYKNVNGEVKGSDLFRGLNTQFVNVTYRF